MSRKSQNRPTRAEARAKRQLDRKDRRNSEPLLRLVAEQEARQMQHGARRRDERDYEPLTENQRIYDNLIAAKELIFGLGVAGTGKTWWSVYRAARAFQAGQINSIVCTRPAVEAGQSLGYLPGDLDEKFANYFRPVRAALDQFLGRGHVDYLIEHGHIQVRPLEFIRGETFRDCWVIADEMQNATVMQHKTLLSRFGENCKMILNGDPEQCDLPRRDLSGLIDAWLRLRSNPKVGGVEFEPDDIVRSSMCKDVILAYRTAAPANEDRRETPRSLDYIHSSDDNDAGLKKFLQAG